MIFVAFKLFTPELQKLIEKRFKQTAKAVKTRLNVPYLSISKISYLY